MDNLTIAEQLNRQPRRMKYYLLVIGLVGGIFWWSLTVVSLQGVSAKGLEIAENIMRGIFRPDLKFLFDLSAQGVLHLILETIAIAVLGTVTGAILAVPLSFLATDSIVPKPVAAVVQLFIMAIRTVPPFVYGLMFIRVTGPSPSAGVLTLGLISIGMISKLFIETIEDLDRGILEAMDAAGCTAFQKICRGIIPQLRPDFLSILLYRFDMNLRDASILGLVGAGGIGAPLVFAMSGYKWAQVGALLIGMFILIILVETLSSRIRNHLLKG